MVKVYCDRCGKEVTHLYYTHNFYAYPVNPRRNFNAEAAATASSIGLSYRDAALDLLISDPMYCEKCHQAFLTYLNGGTINAT